MKQLRALRQREQQLPQELPDPASPLRQPVDTSAAGLWPADSLTPHARQEAARKLRTVSQSLHAGQQTLKFALSGTLSGALSPTGSVGPAEPAVSERQRVQALQLVFTAVMEDVISTLSGCASVPGIAGAAAIPPFRCVSCKSYSRVLKNKCTCT